MNRRVIFARPDGGVTILIPTGEIPIEEVARKDVPEGVAYVFATTDEIPPDREFRDAWEADFLAPDGFGIGQEAWFAEQEAKK